MVHPVVLYHMIMMLQLCTVLHVCSSFFHHGLKKRHRRTSDSFNGIMTHSHEQVFADNVKIHADAVRHSEQLFYGFYPDGFPLIDPEFTPISWTTHVLHLDGFLKEKPCNDTSTIMASSSINVWDFFNWWDELIIPPPFTNNDLARISKTQILSPKECLEIISECDNHYWGWSSSQERYGTPSHSVGQMIKLEDLSRTYSFVNFELLPRLFPAIIHAFPSLKTNATNLRLGGCRVVKYDASIGRVELGLHRDGLLLTANIALNDCDEYEGGGTYLEGLRSFMDNPIRLKKGHCLLHPGDVKHGGAPITKGVRYVLVCFILDANIIPHQKYCLDRFMKDIENLRSIPMEDPSLFEQRKKLLESATKHCVDAYAFGVMPYSVGSNGTNDKIASYINKPSKS